MCKLVDERNLRAAGDDRIGVHLLERGPPVGDLLRRDPFELPQALLDRRTVVRLGERDDDVDTVGSESSALRQHRVGLADSGSGAEQHVKSTPSH